MKKLVGWVSSLVVASAMMISSMAWAQEFDVREVVARTEDARERVVRFNVDFSAEENGEFWPLYEEFRAKLSPVQSGILNVVVEYAKVYTNLSDAQATGLLDEWLSLKKKESKIKTRYLKKFRKILSPKHAIRYVQIENKLDAAMEWEAAISIPLVDQ